MHKVGPPENSGSFYDNAGSLPHQTGLKIIADRYELQALVGRGDVSRVYRAIDRVLNREVAVKLLRQENVDDKDSVTRFLREARFLASLTSPHILKIYDYGHFENVYFIVMEYIEGINLKELEQRTGIIKVEQAIRITDQVLQALTAAHNNRIIHRDIKPHNILLESGSQNVKLTDFGVARTPKSTTITRLGDSVGSIEYMAPEQSTGGVITPAADLYSTGVVLFEMLAGKLPFEGANQMQIALQHVYNQPPTLRSLGIKVPAELEKILQKALDKDPSRRYQTAGEMRAALARVPGFIPLTASNATEMAYKAPVVTNPAQSESNRKKETAGRIPAASVTTPTRRLHPALLIAGLIVLALLVVGGLAFKFGSTISPKSETIAPKTAVAAIFATPASPSPVSEASVTPALALTSPAEGSGGAFTPNPTGSSIPASTPAPTFTVEPTQTPDPTSTTEPTRTPAPTVTTEPTQTPAPSPTLTPQPPTATPAPPEATPTIAPKIAAGTSLSGKLNPYLLQGSYKRPDGTLYGRAEVALYGSGSGYNQGELTFDVTALPSGTSTLVFTGLDDERVAHCNLQIVLNGTAIFNGADLFPDAPNGDNGEGGVDRNWGQFKVTIPPGTLLKNGNKLVLRNTTPWNGYLGIPYLLVNSVEVVAG